MDDNKIRNADIQYVRTSSPVNIKESMVGKGFRLIVALMIASNTLFTTTGTASAQELFRIPLFEMKDDNENVVTEDLVAYYIKKLNHPDVQVRGVAMEKLAYLKDSRAVGPLIKALKDRHPRIRQNAAAYLGLFNDSRAIEPLIEALEDPKQAVQKNAVVSLAELGAQKAMESLIRTLLKIGGEKGYYSGLATLKENFSIAQIVNHFVPKLKSEDLESRKLASAVLIEFTDKGSIRPLIEVFKNDESEDVRGNAAFALANFGSSEIFRILVVGLSEADSVDFQINLTGAIFLCLDKMPARDLNKVQGQEFVRPLVRLLSHENKSVRLNVVQAFGMLASPDLADQIASLLADPSKDVQYATALALSELKDERALEMLNEMLINGSLRERRNSVIGLSRYKDKHTVDVLLVAAKDEDSIVRKDAVLLLGEIRDEKALKVLFEALNDEDAEVQKNASYALQFFDLDNTAEILMKSLQSRTESVRNNAAYILGLKKALIAVEPLIEELKKEQFISGRNINANIIFALVNIGGERATNAVKEYFREKDKEFLEETREVLIKNGIPRQKIDELTEIADRPRYNSSPTINQSTKTAEPGAAH